MRGTTAAKENVAQCTSLSNSLGTKQVVEAVASRDGSVTMMRIKAKSGSSKWEVSLLDQGEEEESI